MRRWLIERVGRPVHLRLTDSGRSILLTRVGLFTVEGLDADGDDACMPLRLLTMAFAGDKVTEGFEAMKSLQRKLRMAVNNECGCEGCGEKRRREHEGQVPPEEIEEVLAEERLRQSLADSPGAEPLL